MAELQLVVVVPGARLQLAAPWYDSLAGTARRQWQPADMSWCVRSFRSLASGAEVHVHLTPCIVATPPRPPAARGEDCCAASHGLVVPANERLAGARFDTSQVHAAGPSNPISSSFCVSVCAAPTLNAVRQLRVTLSLR